MTAVAWGGNCRRRSRLLGFAAAVSGMAMTFMAMVVAARMPLGDSFVPASKRSALELPPNFWPKRQYQQQQQSSQLFVPSYQTRQHGRARTSWKLSQSQETSSIPPNEKEMNDFQRRNQQWVVLVDDEESIRFAVGDFLYDRGYEVTACADASSLLDLIVLKNKAKDTTNGSSNSNISTPQQQQQQQQHRLPDLIISDVRMPESDKNGYELVQFLRSADQRVEANSSSSVWNRRSLMSLTNVPIVLLTAKAMTEDRIMGYKAGADVVLPKPFSPEELVSIIDNLIRRRHQRLQPIPSIATSKNHNPPFQEDAFVSSSAQAQAPPTMEDFRVLKRELDEIKAIVQQKAATTVQKTDIVLTDKERTIVELLAEGYTPREIAAAVRPKSMQSKALDKEEIASIRKIIEGLVETTETESKTELLRWARRVGYILE